MPSKYVSPEEKARKDALRRVIRKVTGGFCFGNPKCAACGKEFTESELLAEDLIWSVGHGTSAQYHRGCFEKEFRIRGGAVAYA